MLAPDNIRANISREYNAFQDIVSEFLNCFRDDRRMLRIAASIADELCGNLFTVSPLHRTHPFMRYGDPGASHTTLVSALFHAVRPKFEQVHRSTRSLVVSFFHASGTNRADLDELMQAFWEFQDTCMGRTDDENDEDDVDADEDAANPNVSR